MEPNASPAPKRGGPPFNPGSGTNADILRCVARREATGDRSWVNAIAAATERNPGQVHPALGRLIREGYLTQTRETDVPNPRSFYELTDLARDLLARIGTR